MRTVARTAFALAVVATIAACDRTPAPAAEPAAPAEAAAPATDGPSQADGGLAIEAEGLRLFDAQGAARAIPFGTPQATAISTVAASVGGAAPEVTTNSECGAGPIQFAEFSNGLQLLFQGGTFQGWFLREPGLTTVNGVGVGSTRADLDEAFSIEVIPDSTLGVEFSAGDLGGFLSADGAAGTVESLYAGLTCFFR